MDQEISDDLRQELKRGIMNNEGVPDLKKRVRKVIKTSKNRAEKIARTETNRANNQGKLQAIKDTDLDYKKKWVSAMDHRTSEICKRLNGQVVELDEKFKDNTTGEEFDSPPAHVNCRSALVFIEEEEKSIETDKWPSKKERELQREEIDVGMKETELRIMDKREQLLDNLEETINGRD